MTGLSRSTSDWQGRRSVIQYRNLKQGTQLPFFRTFEMAPQLFNPSTPLAYVPPQQGPLLDISGYMTVGSLSVRFCILSLQLVFTTDRFFRCLYGISSTAFLKITSSCFHLGPTLCSLFISSQGDIPSSGCVRQITSPLFRIATLGFLLFRILKFGG